MWISGHSTQSQPTLVIHLESTLIQYIVINAVLTHCPNESLHLDNVYEHTFCLTAKASATQAYVVAPGKLDFQMQLLKMLHGFLL